MQYIGSKVKYDGYYLRPANPEWHRREEFVAVPLAMGKATWQEAYDAAEYIARGNLGLDHEIVVRVREVEIKCYA